MIRDSDLEAHFVAALQRGQWPVIDERQRVAAPQVLIDGDRALLSIIAASGVAGRTLRVWRNGCCVVGARSHRTSPAVPEARSILADHGWTLAFRDSGGATVVHRPGVLNVSLIDWQPPDNKAVSVQHCYGLLVDSLAGAMGELGVACDHGPVPGGLCDGAHNLRVGGRKLAGTAGFVTRIDGGTGRVFHAAINISGNVAEDVAIVTCYEAALGPSATYDAAAHITLAEALLSPRCRYPALSPIAGARAREPGPISAYCP